MSDNLQDTGIGARLVRADCITSEQLDRALDIQRDIGGKLGRILVKMGFIEEPDLFEELARHLEIELLETISRTAPMKFLEKIPPRIMRERKIVPVLLIEDQLTLAMADPQDCATIEEVRFETGYKVKPVLALESEIDLVLSGLPKTEKEPDNLRDNLEADSDEPEEGRPPAPEPSSTPQPASLDVLMRMSPRIKVDALIDVLIDEGVVGREAIERAIRSRARDNK